MGFKVTIEEERSEIMKIEIRCNKCGKLIEMQEGNRKEDCLKVEKEWGYFSNKDRELHTFYLCEPCYDDMIEKFEIPIRKQKVEEVV